MPLLFGSPPPPIEDLFVTLGSAAAVTETGTVIVLLPPRAAIAVELVQVRVGLAKLQVQPLLVKVAGGVMPPGMVSSTVIVPVVATLPVFFTVSVYCALVCPATHGPLSTFAIANVGTLHSGKLLSAGATALAMPLLPFVAPFGGNLGGSRPEELLVPLVPPLAVEEPGVPPSTAT